MDKPENCESSCTSHDDSNRLNDDKLLRVLQSIVESLHQQLKICSQVLTLAQDIERGLKEKK